MLQTIATDAIVLVAALWLVWSFGPRSLRRLFTRKTAPSYDTALQADELAGQHAGDDCGCEEKGGR